MANFYQLIILLGFAFCTTAVNINYINKYHLCYPDSVHCILCYQEASNIIFSKPFEQNVYRVQMMDKLNRARSQYATANGISNMKFTNWIREFEALTSAMSAYGTPIIECNLNGSAVNNILNYKIMDFKFEAKLLPTDNHDDVINQQFLNFTSQLVHDPGVMAHNLIEFGCSYTYVEQKLKLTTLLRCMFYTENQCSNKSDLKLGKLCNDCDRRSERCIELVWYKGLCVYNRFNETRLRLIIEPEIIPSSSTHILYVIGSLTIVFVMCAAVTVYLYYNQLPGSRALECNLPMMENIYADI